MYTDTSHQSCEYRAAFLWSDNWSTPFLGAWVDYAGTPDLAWLPSDSLVLLHLGRSRESSCLCV